MFLDNRLQAEQGPALWPGQLHQENSQVFDHAVRFGILVDESQWNEEALADAFFLSISEDIKDRLATIDLISRSLLN